MWGILREKREKGNDMSACIEASTDNRPRENGFTERKLNITILKEMQFLLVKLK